MRRREPFRRRRRGVVQAMAAREVLGLPAGWWALWLAAAAAALFALAGRG